MSISEMLQQSGIMAIIGMGVVFGFLVILVAAITVTGRVIGKFAEPAAVPVQTAGMQASGLPQGNDAVTAAIAAAVNEFRKNN